MNDRGLRHTLNEISYALQPLAGLELLGYFSTGTPSLPESCKPFRLFIAAMFKIASRAEFGQGLSEAQSLYMQPPHHINAEGVAPYAAKYLNFQLLRSFGARFFDLLRSFGARDLRFSIFNYPKRRSSSDPSALRASYGPPSLRSPDCCASSQPPLRLRGGACVSPCLRAISLAGFTHCRLCITVPSLRTDLCKCHLVTLVVSE